MTNYKQQCLCCCNVRFSGLGHVHTALLFIKQAARQMESVHFGKCSVSGSFFYKE